MIKSPNPNPCVQIPLRLVLFLFCFVAGMTGVNGQTTVSIEAESYDNGINHAGTAGGWVGNSAARIGRGNNDGTGYVHVIPFVLPDPAGAVVSDATLTVNFPSGSWGADQLGNVDLYGSLIVDELTSVNYPDFYVDGENPSNPNAVLIQDDFVVTYDLVTGGYGPATSVDLSSFIQGLYDNGAQAGDHCFLILTLDETPTKNYRYLDANTADSSAKPVLALTFSTTPPPITTVEVAASALDTSMNALGETGWVASPGIRIGRSSSGPENWVAVIPFQLPLLNEGTIESAYFEAVFPSASTKASLNLDNIDLFGSGLYDYIGDAEDVSFYVEGYNPGANPDSQLISDNIVTNADLQAGNFGLKVSADIGPYLTDFYNAGVQPGAFIYLTLTNDQYPTNRYEYVDCRTGDSDESPKLVVNIAGAKAFGKPWGATNTITSNGVTWTFDQPVTYGTFATGDFWVVGPVTVVDISNHLNDPAYTPRLGQNESMVNPLSPGQDRFKHGYDDGRSNYDPALNAGLPGGAALSPGNPLIVPVNSSLVSTVSWLYNSSSDAEPGCPSFSRGTPRPATRSAGVLTVLGAVPPDDSFRPPYSGTDKTIRFGLADLDQSVLANLAPVGDDIPDIAAVEYRFSKPWIDHVFKWEGGFSHPSDHMSNYGQFMAQDINDAMLLLNLDTSQLPGSPTRDALLANFIQLGIDFAGIADSGGGWPADGGHGLGRKMPILFAGLVLDDIHMQAVGVWGDGDGNGNGGVEFQEFQNTFYVGQDLIDVTQSGLDPNTGDWPSDHPSAKPGGQWITDARDVWDNATQTVVWEHTPYTNADLGLPEWAIRHSTRPTNSNAHLKANYRDINGSVYPGISLVVEIMGVRALWNDESFMDYADRYMEWTNGGNTSANSVPNFVEDMWNEYRDDYSPLWTAP